MYLTEAGELFNARLDRAFEHLRRAFRGVLRGGTGERPWEEFLRMLTTPQLDALIAVAEQGSFALAARAAGLSQATLHRAARDLERNLDVTLFERTSFGVQPTRQAGQMAVGARLFFREIEQAKAELSAHAGIEAGRTRIGAMPLARSQLVPRAVSTFSRERPGHKVSIVEGPYENLLLALRRGEVDFLVGALRDDLPAADVVQEPLFEDPLSIIMARSHVLAAEAELIVPQLADYPWIMPRAGSPLHRHFIALFHSAGIDPPTDVIECNSMTAARVLLQESDRLMLLSEAQTVFERESGRLVSKPHPQGAVTRTIGLTVRRDWSPTEAQSRIVDLVRQFSMPA
jgi:DNA-binding transcriptional LysR family regulator